MCRTGSLRDFYAALTHLQHTALLLRESVWPQPGKVPGDEDRQTAEVPIADVACRVFVSIHAESAFRTAILSLVEWHGLLVPTATAQLGRLAFIYDHEFIP